MRINSIRFKASILYSAILCIILSAFAVALLFEVESILYRELDDKLKIKAGEMANMFSAYEDIHRQEEMAFVVPNKIFVGYQNLSSQKEALDKVWRSEAEVLSLATDLVQILDGHGTPLANSDKMTDELQKFFQKHLPLSLRSAVYANLGRDPGWRVIQYPFLYQDRNPFFIRLATPLTSVTKILHELTFYAVLTVIFVLLFTSFLGEFFTKKILTPVLSVVEAANRISHKDLNLRIEAKHIDEEMKYLIDSFNTMIDRLEHAFEHISDFSSHVAHELKTPLSIIRGEMELALCEERPSAEYKRVLQVSLEEIDRLIKLVKDLLLLAKLDYRPEFFKFEKINVVDFLKEIYTHASILGAEKKVEFHLDVPQKPVYIQCDPAHFRRLFFNLLHNAIKYTPALGQVTISIQIQDKNVHIAVTDTGEGISPEHLSKIFDKFYRAHKDHGEIESGSGLGLSIALSIAKAHHGTITVQSKIHQGTIFTVILPLA